jgi:hypothetical protein
MKSIPSRTALTSATQVSMHGCLRISRRWSRRTQLVQTQRSLSCNVAVLVFEQFLLCKLICIAHEGSRGDGLQLFH